MLASMNTVLAWAEERGCAAAAFDTPNLELLLAAIGAAEARDEPVIVQMCIRDRFTGVQGAMSASIGYLEINGGTFKSVACATHGTSATFYALYAAGETGKVQCDIHGGHFETCLLYTSRCV